MHEDGDRAASRHRGRHRPAERTARGTARGTALSRFGSFTGRHPAAIVLVWLAVVVACFATAAGGIGGQSLFERLHTDEPSVPGEARTGQDLLSHETARGTTLLLQARGVDVGSPATAAAATASAAALREIPGVRRVSSPYLVPGGPSTAAAAPLLAGGSTASRGFLTSVELAPGLDGAADDRATAAVSRQLTALGSAMPGASIRLGGGRLLEGQINTQIETDLRIGEGVALPVSLLVMVFVFGGFLAAAMPILGAVASIGGGLACLLGFSHLIDLDATVVNVVTVLGLGLCIDYGLLTVSRFREELSSIAARGRPGEITGGQVALATARTTATAGRTVLFSGLTVAISLGGLLVFPASIMRALGAAGVSVVLVAVLVALSLVPALCALCARRLLGERADSASDSGAFSALAQRVQRRPVLVLLGVLVLLVAVATPALGLRLTSSGAELLPRGVDQRTFFDDLRRDYPASEGPSVTLVARAPLAEVSRWATGATTTLPGITSIEPPVQASPGVVAVRLYTAGGGLDQPARTLAAYLRLHRPPFPSWVTGRAAELADYTASLKARAPIVFALIAAATFALLFLMTGSLVIPLKALLTNVVSLGASLGVVVWIFQHGHGESLIGFSSVGAVESTIPLLLLAFGFGLSMDYEVFLLSRISELHEQGVATDRAVVLGLQRSGRIITSAAILIVIVFLGFAAGKLLVIKETGVALAVCILIDATLVRMLLVPATMTLLGRWNWWAPAPLRRWHQRHGRPETALGVTRD